jgi:hypothetical protein
MNHVIHWLGPSIKALKLRSADPDHVDLRFLQELLDLEVLDINFHIYTVPDLRCLKKLRMISFEARACIVFTTCSWLPPTVKAARAVCNGYPFDIFTYACV